MSVEAELVRTPTHRVKNLDSLTGVRAEMTNVYRLARKGEMKTEDMTRYIYALRCISQVIEQTGFDERLAQLSDAELIALIDQKIRTMEARQNGGPAPRSETHNGSRPPS